jgi:hypothetical protein
MSERVLGIRSVLRFVWFGFRTIFEELCFTPDKVIVARTGTVYGRGGVLAAYQATEKAKEFTESSAEEILKTDMNNFVIPNSEIKKVELRKFVRGSRINVITNYKKYGWFARGIPLKKVRQSKLMEGYCDQFSQIDYLFQNKYCAHKSEWLGHAAR